MMNSKYNTIHRSREPQFLGAYGGWRLEVGVF